MDLNQDPTLLFVFQGPAILKESVHNQLRGFIEKHRLEDETINFVNDDGFTPLLYYLNKFLSLKAQTL